MVSVLDILIRIILAPVLIWQGKRVRKTALILPEPKGERSGELGAGPQLSLLILGDSSAAGVGVDRQDQALAGLISKRLSQSHHLYWRLIAKTGATTASTIKQLENQDAEPFDIVLIALGVNDVTRGVPLKRWLEQQDDLHSLLREKCQASKIYISGLPPMGSFTLLPNPLRWYLGRQAQRFDQHIQVNLRSKDNIQYVGLNMPFDPALMASDGFHPGPKAYEYWADMLCDQIEKDLT